MFEARGYLCPASPNPNRLPKNICDAPAGLLSAAQPDDGKLRLLVFRDGVKYLILLYLVWVVLHGDAPDSRTKYPQKYHQDE
jgi:hypothetical protein